MEKTQPEELSHLAELRHPNIVPLLAARAHPPDYSLVFPRFRIGSISRAVHELHWLPLASAVLKHASEIASALHHMHSRRLLHRDIKLDNVFLSDDLKAKVSDFDLATREDELQDCYQARSEQSQHSRQPSGGFHKQHMVGTLEYLAPELLMAGAARRASDVYSFAVTVNELATQTQPYTDRKRSVALAHTILDYSYNNDNLAKAIASEGLRPTLPAPHESGGIASVVERAWSHDPCARPSIDTILTEIDQLARDRLGGKGGGTDTLHPVWYEPRGRAGPVEEYVKNALRANRNEEEASTARREEEEANERLTMEPGHSVAHALAQLKQPYCRPSAHIAPGRRRGQDRFEDRHLVASPSEQLPSTHVLGIFDGHGGWECAEYVKEHLEPVLADQAAKTCSLTMALHASFEELESGFAHVVAQTDSYKAGKSPGTTALVVVHHAHGLTIASAGDCRAVACRDGAAVELNSTQLASDLHERMRVERNGGYVMKTDSWRVGSFGLQVTRSIGDYEAKEEGVTAEPVVSHVQLSENDRYVLLASDGVWDVMTAQQAIDLCESTVKDTDMMARRVADAVEDNGGFDNATVIVAALQPLSSVQRVY